MGLNPKRLFQGQPGKTLNLIGEQPASLENLATGILNGSVTNFDVDPNVSLLADPAFTTGVADWQANVLDQGPRSYGGSYANSINEMSHDTTTGNGDSTSMRVGFPNGGASGWNRYGLRSTIYQTVDPGDVVRVKFDYKQYGNPLSAMSTSIVWYNSNNQIVGWDEVAYTGTFDNTWRTQEGFVTAPYDATKYKIVIAFSTSSGNSTYGAYFDNFITSKSGANGWSNVSNASSFARSTAQAKSGAGSLTLVSASAGDVQFQSSVPVQKSDGTYYTMTDWYNPYVVSDRGTIRFAASFRTAAVTRNFQMGVRWFTETGSLLATDYHPDVVSVGSGAWVDAERTFRAPELAVYARPIVKIVGATAGGEVYYMDAVTFEETLGWKAGDANTTLSRTTDRFYFDSASMQLSSVAAGTMTAHTTEGEAGIPVIGGQAYLAGIRAVSAAVSRSVTLGIRWFDENGDVISTVTGDAIATNVGDAKPFWKSAVAYGVAPPAAATAALVITVTGVAGAAEVHNFDGASASQVLFRVPDDGSVDYAILKQVSATATGSDGESLILSVIPSGDQEGPNTRLFHNVSVAPGGALSFDTSQVMAPGDCITAVSSGEELTLTCSGVEVTP